MNINKATEDTMKELAKFLRQIGKDGSPEQQTQVKALNKAMTQARANIAETKKAFDDMEAFTGLLVIEVEELKAKTAEFATADAAPGVTLPEAGYTLKVDPNGFIAGVGVINLGVSGFEDEIQGQVGESEFENFPVIYVNPEQLLSGAKLIAVRDNEQAPNFTLGLYRKRIT